MGFIKHLIDRGYHNKLHSWVDMRKELITFPLWNLSGQLIGYQQYNWKATKDKRSKEDGRYWTYNAKENIAVYGLDTIDWSKPLYLVEGVWDAITVQNTGRNCIAVLTNNPKHLRNWLSCLPVKIIAICEGDENGEGYKLARYGDSAIYLKVGKDPNSMGEAAMDELLSYFEESNKELVF